MGYFSLTVSIAAIGPHLVGPGTWVLRLVAWSLTGSMVWSLWRAIGDVSATARKMHQIPCSGCRYFTQDYYLKCTVHPSRALSEEAIGCRDFSCRDFGYRDHDS
jgi:hypothetical protein